MRKLLIVSSSDFVNVGREFLYDYDKQSLLSSFRNLQSCDERLDALDLIKSEFKKLDRIPTDVLDFIIFTNISNCVSLEQAAKEHNIAKELISDLKKFISSYNTYKLTKGCFDTIDILNLFNNLLDNNCIRKDILENYKFEFKLNYTESPRLIKSIIDKLTVD